MKLFFATGACSLASRIVLNEAGFPFQGIRVDLQTHALEDGSDFRAVNPKGQVPVLELDDGSLLSENVAVLQYLADLDPSCHLAPPNGTLERYRLQEWLGFLAAEVHKAFAPFFKNGNETERQQAREKLKANFDYLESMLEGRDFLTGRQFTVADAYLYVMLGWAEAQGMGLSMWPRLAGVHARISDKPAVLLAEQAEDRHGL